MRTRLAERLVSHMHTRYCTPRRVKIAYAVAWTGLGISWALVFLR